MNIDSYSLSLLNEKSISGPIIKSIYSADPSAHVFNGLIYIYPSHDIENDIPFDDLGSHFAMNDYHVLSLDNPDGEVKDHGVVLKLEDIPWAKQQLWAPDAAEKDGKYYLFFPAKDQQEIFRIGVAVGQSPAGPFIPEHKPIPGSYSIDPAVFKDDDGAYYMYFGGIWGGQLQRWRSGVFQSEGEGPLAHLPGDDEPALCAKVAKMSDDMLRFAEPPRDVLILDENGDTLKSGDHDRRFFEASWVHKYKDKYYFSYSTGNTHFICYGIGDSPYGPFVYKGKILNPVVGWTTHHSICLYKNDWYLFYHDSLLSGGVTHLRSVKFTRLEHDENGLIKTIDPYNL